ncbi:Dimer Tnp hAT domain-containing protein [Aphis craccivora]|uniref:Dimer Tnp hAT domain-containing protein n=1 Tax=Aphis craccivora TaxID=307492 RepID=A0A6G0YHP7_APHCR|nr:Dimer Tnp hAT domain-containing protein [Aphis craccivora]
MHGGQPTCASTHNRYGGKVCEPHVKHATNRWISGHKCSILVNELTHKQPNVLFTISLTLFVLPGSNAAVERVFLLMNSTWTNSRNKLDIKTVEATLIIKMCFNNKSYEVFYDQILRNKSL